MVGSNLSLRPYQEQALQQIIAGFAEHDKQLAVLPTGAGKTILFARLAAHYQPRKTLVLAHRDELIQQAVDKIQRATGLMADVEMSEQHADLHAPVVVASVQTLMRDARRKRWPRDHFGLLVVDEAHHVLADSYRRILAHFDEDAFVLGVTATPDRGDKRCLGQYFDNIACEVSLIELVRDGWLAPIRAKTVPVQVDLRGVRTTAGDYNADDLGHAIEPYLARIADVMAEHRDRKSLVFLPLIRLSQQFATMCRERGVAAEHVDGQSPDRAAILRRLAMGETTLVSNAMLLTEGFDEPSVDCIVCLRPTKVRALYAQIVGRGTRPHPGKDYLLLLDFLWLSGQHSLIKPAHLLASDDKEAQAISEYIGTDGDILEAKERADADRAESLRKQLERTSRRSSKTYNVIELALSLDALDVADFVCTMRWHDDPVSPKQAEMLRKFGIDPDTCTCKGQASALLDKLFARQRLKLATARQVVWLHKLGHPSPHTATMAEASAFLDSKFSR